MIKELTKKQLENKRYELRDFIAGWNQLWYIVHNPDYQMNRRISKKGKVIPFLEDVKKVQHEK